MFIDNHRWSLRLLIGVFIVALFSSCDRKVTLLNCPNNQIGVGSICVTDLFFQKFFGSFNFNFLNTPPPSPIVLDGPSHSLIEEGDFIFSNSDYLSEINWAIIDPFFEANYGYCEVESLSKLADGKKTILQFSYIQGQPDSGRVEIDGRKISYWYQENINNDNLSLTHLIESSLENLKLISYEEGYDSQDNYRLLPSYYINVDFRQKTMLYQDKISIFRQPYAAKMTIHDKSHMDIITNIDFSISAELLLIPKDYKMKESFVLAQGVYKVDDTIVYFNRHEDLALGSGSPNSYTLPTETIQYNQSIMDQLPQSISKSKTLIPANWIIKDIDDDINQKYFQYFYNCIYDIPLDTPLENNNNAIKLDEGHHQ